MLLDWRGEGRSEWGQSSTTLAGGTMELCVAEKKPTRTADAVGILVLDRFSRVKRGV